MDELIQQLFEEYKRIKELHTEVNLTYDKEQKRLEQLRREKAKHIYDFLQDIWTVLKDFYRIKVNAEEFYIVVAQKATDNGSIRDCIIVFSTCDIWTGIIYQSYYDKQQKLSNIINGERIEFAAKGILDNWDEKTEDYVTKEAVKYIRKKFEEITINDIGKLEQLNNTIKKYE